MTFQRISAITMNAGETTLTNGVLDTNNNIAYFLTNQNPAKLIKVDIPTFSRFGAITLSINTSGGATPGIDINNGFIYVGSTTSPATISKVRLSDFTEVATLVLSISGVRTCAIDNINGFAYFPSNTNPSIVSKVRLSDFTEVATLATSNSSSPDAIAIDIPNGFLYLADYISTTIITKIRLSNFTEVTTLNSTVSYMHSLAIDDSKGFAYFIGGGGGVNVTVGKVSLSTFSLDSTLVIPGIATGRGNSIAIDTSNGFLYFGTNDQPARIFQIKLYDFTQGTTVAFNTGENNIIGEKCILLDPVKGFGYASLYNPNPSKIVKFGLDGVFAHITATVITAIPSEPCLEGTCIVNVSVTWQNIGGTIGSFVPNISIDGIPISPAPYLSEQVDTGSTTTHTFTISGLTKAGSPHTICPVPN